MRAVPKGRLSQFTTLVFSCVLFLLSACSNGSGSAGSGPTVNDTGSITKHGDKSSVTVSPGSLYYETFKSNIDTRASIKKTIHVEFEGEGVLIGFPPKLSEPNWLRFSDTSIVAPTKSFDLSVFATAPVTPGTYETTLRFVAGYADGSDYVTADVPVKFVVEPTPVVYSGSVTFASNDTDMQLAEPQTLQLDFGRLSDGTFTSTVRNINSQASDWLQVETNQVTKLNPVGAFQGEVLIKYDYNGATVEKAIPIEYAVTATRPNIHYVVPPAVYVNQANNIILRGTGFSTKTIQQVSVGSIQATSFEIINDTEIRATLAAIATEGNYAISVTGTNATYSASSSLAVKQKLAVAAGTVEFATGVVDYEFDSKRDAVIVATRDTLYRVKLVNGSWVIVSQRVLATGNIELTPDSDQIVYVDNKFVHVLNAETLADVEAITLPYIHIGAGGSAYTSVNLQQITNNGDLLLVLSDQTGGSEGVVSFV